VKREVSDFLKENKHKKAYLEAIFNSNPHITVITDSINLIDANSAFFDFFNEYSSVEEFRNDHSCIYDFFESGQGEEFLTSDNWIKDSILLNEDRRSKRKVLIKHLGIHYFSVATKKLSYGNSKNLYIVSFTDITELEELKNSLAQKSIIDDLTEIYNRRHFNSIFPKEVKRSKSGDRRESSFLTLFIADVDNFKKYNDTYGHQAGDSVLKKIAKTINSRFKRGSDYFFRLGGEEFGAIYQAKDIESAVLWAERIRTEVEFLHIEHKENVGGIVTVSIGLFTADLSDYPKDLSSSDIYDLADKALYESKNLGRNRVTLYSTIDGTGISYL